MNTRKKTWVKSIFSEVKNKVDTAIPKKLCSNGDLSDTASPAKKLCTDFADTDKTMEENAKGKTMKSTCEDFNTETSLTHWMDIFAPTKLDELAVHAKKLAEVQEWLHNCGRPHAAQISLLTGPTGSGKTTAIKLVARDNHFQVQEWINPVDMELITTLDETNRPPSYIGSQVNAFKSFLWRASRYNSLFSASNKRLLLVEDFPNALINDSTTFISILEEFLCYGDALLVFVVADAKSKQLNIAYNLFTDETKISLNIKHITFNAVAPTLLNKAMKRFCNLIAQTRFAKIYTVPPTAVVEGIAFSAQGDIRNALINLHFASLIGAPCLKTKQLQPVKPTARGKNKQYALQSVGRDESITMMHVLGRVFNPKYSTDERFVHTPESLVDLISNEPKKLVNFMHANYLQHFGDIDNIILAVDGLSLADVLFKEYREDIFSELGLNIATRSLMVANKAPVPGWKPVRGPTRINANNPPLVVLERYKLRPNISANLFASEYSTFIKYIQK